MENRGTKEKNHKKGVSKARKLSLKWKVLWVEPGEGKKPEGKRRVAQGRR